MVNDKQAHETDADADAFRKLVVSKYGPRSAERLGGRAPSIHWVQAVRAEKGRLEGKLGRRASHLTKMPPSGREAKVAQLL